MVQHPAGQIGQRARLPEKSSKKFQKIDAKRTYRDIRIGPFTYETRFCLRTPSGFKSRPEHQTARSTCSFAGQLFDLAFIAYGFCSLFQEITSHRGKKRLASQIPQVHKEPSDSIFTISKIGH